MKERKRFTREEIRLLNRIAEIKGGSWPSEIWEEYRLLCGYFFGILPLDSVTLNGVFIVTIEEIRTFYTARERAKNLAK